MDVNMTSSISGLYVAQTRQDITANDIANINTQGYEESRPYQTDMAPAGVKISYIAKTPNTPDARSNTDLIEETKEQIINKNTYAADLRVIKVKDRMVGELLDMVG